MNSNLTEAIPLDDAFPEFRGVSAYFDESGKLHVKGYKEEQKKKLAANVQPIREWLTEAGQIIQQLRTVDIPGNIHVAGRYIGAPEIWRRQLINALQRKKENPGGYYLALEDAKALLEALRTGVFDPKDIGLDPDRTPDFNLPAPF